MAAKIAGIRKGRGMTAPIRLYRPSNGTEGMCFFEGWCERCARDKEMSEGKPFDECSDDEICSIIADSFAFDVTDERYPSEWIYDANGEPCCTAFIPAGEAIPPPVDDKTLDLFGGEA